MMLDGLRGHNDIVLEQPRRPIARRGVVAIGIAAVVAGVTFWSYVERQGMTTIELMVPTGVLRVERAASPEDRAAGLANRDTIQHDGLLLEWDEPDRHPIWMAGMRFSLDLIWLDPDDRVLAVLLDVAPCTQQPCPLYEPPGTERSIAVLELPAGGAARHRITMDTGIRRVRPPSRRSR